MNGTRAEAVIGWGEYLHGAIARHDKLREGDHLRDREGEEVLC